VQARSLYLHFPFCETKCHYCDFYSIAAHRASAKDPLDFRTALKKEAELSQDLIAPQIETIFMGGGTPSMTPPEHMAEALEPLLTQKPLAKNYEWTMEANPSSITLSKLEKYKALGVNRISMGVQSLDDGLLKKLGRVHLCADVFRALDEIFESGISNVSTDLLCGVPGQTLQDLESALERLFQYPLTHLSCYLLTLAPHHPMAKDLPDENTQLEHLLFIDRWMTAHGFEHYEISNYCRDGLRAQHNMIYWQGGSYLGLGPSAHSFDTSSKRRWKNLSSLHRYVQELQKGTRPVEWEETLTDQQSGLERWMLALRLSEGFSKDWLITPLQQTRARELLEKGLMELHPVTTSNLRLTPRGFALSDQIVLQLG